MTPELAEVDGRPVLVWRLSSPWLAVSSSVLGGGLGERHWVLNATVEYGYTRLDPDRHLAEIASSLGLTGEGIGLLTAVDVREVVHRADEGVHVSVTTGIGGYPTWAAGPAAVSEKAGTINTVCWLPRRLSPAALVNAVATVAEAKAQALLESGIAGTGTPTDAVALLCPPVGEAEPFGGPRSPVGGPLARAVWSAIRAGL
ncbi:adenosylcobinamide amidohydrolase [Actinophytocola oryzae]|uniref:Adenosylcobinamide amidohydrolase n=1 Tax=Actinophytocola oryzae TaxID=502181 RepID=A0A4R7USE7_9PSEU|nr:adenosylcobinamide amidohydrolase [Actinophytocola oryzae]TDV36864.1 adenosylcobinamide amidohydrolase [Actinophytocola oryzae]